MKFTATVDLEKGLRWGGHSGGVKKHAEHDSSHQNVSNEYLLSYASKRARIFNRAGNCASLENMVEKYYGGSMLEENNARQKKNRHNELVYDSALDFAQHKGKDAYYNTMVATFGDKEANQQLFDMAKNLDSTKGLTDEQIQERIWNGVSKGLESYARGFNHRNKSMTLTDYSTNVDEFGAYHVHAQVMPHGHTANGRISASVDTALAEQGITGKGNKGRLSSWRLDEDKALMRHVRKGLSTELDGLPRFSLFRKNEHNNMSHSEYIANQERTKSLAAASAANRRASAANSKASASIRNASLAASAAYSSAADSLLAESRAVSAERSKVSAAQSAANASISQASEAKKETAKEHNRLIRLIGRVLKVLFPEWAKNIKDGKPSPWHQVAAGNAVVWNEDHSDKYKGIDAVKYGLSKATNKQLNELRRKNLNALKTAKNTQKDDLEK